MSSAKLNGAQKGDQRKQGIRAQTQDPLLN
jgi:hypothetical protein